MSIDAALSQNHPEIVPFSAAAAEGRFTMPTCRACARAHWYPRAFCPFCFSFDVEWVEASGDGEIYSFCNPAPAPGTNVIAYVRVKEGPILLTHLLDADPASIQIGRAVRVSLQAAKDGQYFPAFKLA